MPVPATWLVNVPSETEPNTFGTPPVKDATPLISAVTFDDMAERIRSWVTATNDWQRKVPWSSRVPLAPVPVQLAVTVRGYVNVPPPPPPPFAGAAPLTGTRKPGQKLDSSTVALKIGRAS